MRLFYFLAITLPFFAQLQASPLDLAACQAIALDTNPLSRAAAYGVQIACETVGVARSQYYPQVGIEAHYARWQTHNFLEFNVPPTLAALIGPYQINPENIGPTNDYGLSVSTRYTIYDWGARRARLMAALAEQGAACEQAEQIQQQILLNVALAYYNLIAYRELQIVAQKNLERTSKHHNIAEDRKEVGAVPLADVYRAQVNVAQAKQELVHANSMVRIAKGNLSTSMGLPPDTGVEIIDQEADFFSPAELDVRQAQAKAVHTRPEIRTIGKQLCAIGYRVKEAQSQFGPRFEAEGLYGKRDATFFPSDDEFSVGVVMTMPIFTGFGLEHQLRRVKAEYCQLQAQYESLSLQIQQEVWQAYASLNEAYEVIVTAMAQVTDAMESNRLSEERYTAGAGTITDLLDTQTMLVRSEASYVEALWKFRAALSFFQWTQGIMEINQ